MLLPSRSGASLTRPRIPSRRAPREAAYSGTRGPRPELSILVKMYAPPCVLASFYKGSLRDGLLVRPSSVARRRAAASAHGWVRLRRMVGESRMRHARLFRVVSGSVAPYLWRREETCSSSGGTLLAPAIGPPHGSRGSRVGKDSRTSVRWSCSLPKIRAARRVLVSPGTGKRTSRWSR